MNSSYRWNRRIRYPLAWVLFLSSPMLAFFLYNIYSWGLGFWAYLIPLIVGAIGFAYHTNDRDEKLAPLRAHFGKIAG